MSVSFGWAKHPIVNRIGALREDIPITLLYGSRSWVENTPGEYIREKRQDSYANIQVYLAQFIKNKDLNCSCIVLCNLK
jgi:abhydrolase domain-containing protein 5